MEKEIIYDKDFFVRLYRKQKEGFFKRVATAFVYIFSPSSSECDAITHKLDEVLDKPKCKCSCKCGKSEQKPKPTDTKPVAKVETLGSDVEPVEAKPVESKPVEAKPVEAKPETKPVATKTANKRTANKAAKKRKTQ